MGETVVKISTVCISASTLLKKVNEVAKFPLFHKIKHFISFSSSAFADHENTSFPDFFLDRGQRGNPRYAASVASVSDRFIA